MNGATPGNFRQFGISRSGLPMKAGRQFQRELAVCVLRIPVLLQRGEIDELKNIAGRCSAVGLAGDIGGF